MSFVLNRILLLLIISLLFISCSLERKIARSAKNDVLAVPALQTAHVGISIFEPATNRYWFNHQGDKYFVPASNTKIPTCYAAMKYLGDSLVGLLYGVPEDKYFKELVVIKPSADPTFLHSDFSKQPVLDFLKNIPERNLAFSFDSVQVNRWGSGWSWNDYQEPYMAERNPFPVFGNVITIRLNDVRFRNATDDHLASGEKLKLFATGSKLFDSLVNNIPTIQSLSRYRFLEESPKWQLSRMIQNNWFEAERSTRPFTTVMMPFVTNGVTTGYHVLEDTLKRDIRSLHYSHLDHYILEEPGSDLATLKITNWKKIYSQSTDSLLKLMMHRSDNFFAEQSLLMVSNEVLGIINDRKIIDTLLKTDFKDLPQKPRWADGSGLSRYNLFTPQDMVQILNKMHKEFDMKRIKEIFPTGGEGTISSYYKNEANYIFAKTGTLSGVVALSGFLFTKKDKLLIFSVLVNNHQASATEVRRAVEKFIQNLRGNY